MQHTNSPCRRTSCNGFSLVEMLVVVALSSLLMGVVVSLMLGLRQWDRLSRTNSTRNEQLLRLASALRSDIRSGTDVLVSINGPLVVMTASGEQLRYELDAEGCRRTVVGPGAVEPRADLFAIGKAEQWNVARKAPGRYPLVAVTLAQDATKDESAKPRPIPLLVYAALGADLLEPAGTTN